eukprot:Em0016g536a
MSTPVRGGQASSKKKGPFETKLVPPFEDYWTKERVSEGLKRQELIKGKVRINQRNYEEAFIDDPDFGRDYFIKGLQNRNRAFHDDVVVVQVLSRDQWIPIEEFKQLQMEPEMRLILPGEELTSNVVPDEIDGASVDFALKVTDDTASNVTCAADDTTISAADDAVLEVALKETLIDRLYSCTPIKKQSDTHEAEELEAASQKSDDVEKFIRTVKVVYIMEKQHSRACAGFLKAFDKAGGRALLSPKDAKVPRVVVPLKECPENYCQNPKEHQSTLFICKINDWPSESPFATGNLMRSLGEAGEIEPETESFLLDNDVDYSEFSADVLDCLPKDLPWAIPEDEKQKRGKGDFRKECVFSIDPATARDLDDALHVKSVADGIYEVGVHIADVSYFVKAGTSLDTIASSRATSVYLVQRVIPMLPRLLCEQLCSLNPDEERLTFSVVWTMSTKGEFISEWMGRSMIRSCAKLTYDHAQLMIEEPERDWQPGDLPNISGGFTAAGVSKCVNILNQLARTLKRQRQSKGTLQLNQPKLVFSLSKETGMPNGCSVYQHKESHSLIEEFMLMANMAVARKIYECFPEQALLRRHPPPKRESVNRLETKCRLLGIGLDGHSAEALQTSLNSYKCQSKEKEVSDMEKQTLLTFCLKVMELARYFCTGTVDEDVFLHYALNVPRYTHFTSPIRRYADLVVHRQLAAALGEGLPFTDNTEAVQAQAEICNKKKKSSKIVQELSTQLFFSLFLRECGPLKMKGMVQQILDKSFDVLVLDFGVIKRVYCDKLGIKDYKYEAGNIKQTPCINLIWEIGSVGEKHEQKQTLTVFSEVQVELSSAKDNPLQYEARILGPN